MKPGGNFTLSEFVRLMRVGALIAVIVFIALVARLTFVSAHHHRLALEAGHAERYEEAIRSYTWSIRNYYPGNPYSARSLKNALNIVDRYDEEGKSNLEQQALGDLHAALLALRSFYQPYPDELRRIEAMLHRSQNRPSDSGG